MQWARNISQSVYIGWNIGKYTGGMGLSFIRIQGLHRLQGEVGIQGSKNAVLPVMAAALLHSGTIVITNVPNIQDVFCMMGILEYMGCRCQMEGHTLVMDTRGLVPVAIPEGRVKQMRSSVMLLGPLLGRLGEAKTCHPGGCSIGKRPIDLHLWALRDMGADIRVEGEKITASATGLQGARLSLPFPSVGATENAIMAAVAAKGVTTIHGAAREPEIEVLCRFLTSLGAEVFGIGTSVLSINGRRPLKDGEFAVPGDRIVAGTYLGAVMAAGGEAVLSGAPVSHMGETLAVARKMGCGLEVQGNQVRARMRGRPRPVKLCTGPYPAFSTDLQSVTLAVASVAEGGSKIREDIFEERFATARQLQKMGAHIIIDGGTAQVEGVFPLMGSRVQAADLRGGAALVVAALAAEGASEIRGYSHISRGYEDICRDLASIGGRLVLEDP